MIIHRRALVRGGLCAAILAALSSCGAVEPAFAKAQGIQKVPVLKDLHRRLRKVRYPDGKIRLVDNGPVIDAVFEWLGAHKLKLPVTFENGTTLARLRSVPDDLGQVSLFFVWSNPKFDGGAEHTMPLNIQRPPLELQRAA
ncbi:hypothetical protein [Methylobacterium ajmalii]|uniref:hypothetical protein n=1 Tax=Methylobacterium ajmalii TaxID=2738439 RepID=UPI002F36071B